MALSAYSPSALDLFDKCTLAFRYRYVDRVADTLGETLEQYLGKTVHSTLEWIHVRAQEGAPPMWHEIEGDFFHRYDEGFDDRIRFVKPDRTREGYRTLGSRCLRSYFENNTPFDRGSLIAVEWDFRFRMTGDRDGPLLAGRIDRLTRMAPGHIQVHDYKTGSYVPPRHEVERSRQARVYALAVRDAFPEAATGRLEMIWHFLQSGMQVSFEVRQSALESGARDIASTIRAIEAAAEFPANPSRLCPWCEFGHICPEFGYRQQVDGSRTAAGGPDEGLLLVDRLERLVGLKREFDRAFRSEKERIERSIAERAREAGVDALVGTRSEAVVTSEGKVRIRKRRA